MQLRIPHSGESGLHGQFLPRAQGEDLAAGWRLPQQAQAFAQAQPQEAAQLTHQLHLLEGVFGDALQADFLLTPAGFCITALRPARRGDEAGLRMALALQREGKISARQAMALTPPGALTRRLHPTLDTRGAPRPLGQGQTASPGAAVGRVVFFAEHAEQMAAKGEPCILVRHETTPEDINGFHCARGIITVRGGFTSHAAVVARGMGLPCIVGAKGLQLNYHINEMRLGQASVRRDDWLSMDGSSGMFYAGQLPLGRPELGADLAGMLHCADQTRTLRVLANADTPADARHAAAQGAQGIGLCRTEHMFFELERIRAFRRMILATSLQERQAALAALLPMQRKDFEGIFQAMDGQPVVIRFLDPPLHEFLPEGVRSQHRMASTMDVPLERIQQRVDELHEQNPMMGRRGCRLALTNPEIYRMQTRAIMEAACAVKKQGGNPIPKLMIPLVSAIGELSLLRRQAEAEAEAVLAQQNLRLAYSIGVMVETPRAALCAAALAHYADFLSFGTNDLTQMTYGFSRDDTGGFLPRYLEDGVLKYNPFIHLDAQGVVQLVQLARERARAVKPHIELGICGEHGGDPLSVHLFHQLGLDYVSCSPFRIPQARLAAGQAAVAST